MPHEVTAVREKAPLFCSVKSKFVIHITILLPKAKTKNPCDYDAHKMKYIKFTRVS